MKKYLIIIFILTTISLILSCNSTSAPQVPDELQKEKTEIFAKIEELAKHPKPRTKRETESLHSDFKYARQWLYNYIDKEKKAGIKENRDDLLKEMDYNIVILSLDIEKYGINDRVEWIKQHEQATDDIYELKTHLDHLESLKERINEFNMKSNEMNIRYEGMGSLQTSIDLQITGTQMQINALKKMQSNHAW